MPVVNPNHFVYHAPTEDTAPRYAAIRAAEDACHDVVNSLTMAEYTATAADYIKVNSALRVFAETIDSNAPDSADKTAAYRCVRLARNALNEHLATCFSDRVPPPRINLLYEAQNQLVFARWQANSAVACGGR